MGFNCLMSWTDFVYLLWGPEKYGVQKRKSRKETVNTREQWMLLTDKSSSPNRKPNPGEIAPLLRELWCQCYTGGFKMFQRSFFPLPTWDISSFFGEKLYWDQRHPSPMRHTETIPWARTQVEAGTFKSRCLICETKYGAITLGQHTSRAWSAGATCHPGTCWDMLGPPDRSWNQTYRTYRVLINISLMLFSKNCRFPTVFPFNLPPFRPPQRRDVPFGKPTGALAVERFGEIG